MPQKKNYTRREAIKYGAKIGLGAGIWGAIGNFSGRVYDHTVKPVADRVEETYEGLHNLRESLNRLNPFRRNTPTPAPKPVSRRGFLSSLLGKAHQNPITAGTIIGATYGTGKYALGGLSRYLTKREIAILKDENAGYRERLEVLEAYKAGIKEDLKAKDDRLDYLEGELKKVNGIERQIKHSKLEETVSEGEGQVSKEGKDMLLSLGVVGFLISIGLSSLTLTGNVVINTNNTQLFTGCLALFIVSLSLVLFGIEDRQKNKKKRKFERR